MSFAQDLQHIRDRITAMGGLVESQLSLAIRAVAARDTDAASRAVAQDAAVDAIEREVEAAVIQSLALRQPMARDLRETVTALKIVGAIERIGDYAKNVAKRSRVLAEAQIDFPLAGLTHMGRLVQENLKLMIDAIGESDAAKAGQVWRADQPVDDLYNGLFRELLTYMMENPRNITPCTHLLFIAKNLERIGDHTTNIAELLHYAVTGDILPDARPKGESVFAAPGGAG